MCRLTLPGRPARRRPRRSTGAPTDGPVLTDPESHPFSPAAAGTVGDPIPWFGTTASPRGQGTPIDLHGFKSHMTLIKAFPQSLFWPLVDEVGRYERPCVGPGRGDVFVHIFLLVGPSYNCAREFRKPACIRYFHSPTQSKQRFHLTRPALYSMFRERFLQKLANALVFVSSF